MKNISFTLTTPQFKAKTKSVTRRIGWKDLKPGDHLMGCEKCMGRKPGEPLVRLGEIEVVTVRFERLDRMVALLAYGRDECRKEGFPDMNADEFVEMFCSSHKGCEPSTVVTRISFKYL